MKRLAGVLFVASCLTAPGGAHAAFIFNFQFDNQGISPSNLSSDGPIVPPVVGTGTFTSPSDLSPGTYGLTTLPGFLLSFNVGGDAYNQTNITTPLTGVAVRIVNSGAGERLFFTESGGAGSDGGPQGGALDLAIPGHDMSFEPSRSGGNYDYFEEPTELVAAAVAADPAGRYCAVSAGGVCPTSTVSLVPEPSALALLASGIGFLFAFRRRSRGA